MRKHSDDAGGGDGGPTTTSDSSGTVSCTTCGNTGQCTSCFGGGCGNCENTGQCPACRGYGYPGYGYGYMRRHPLKKKKKNRKRRDKVKSWKESVLVPIRPNTGTCICGHVVEDHPAETNAMCVKCLQCGGYQDSYPTGQTPRDGNDVALAGKKDQKKDGDLKEELLGKDPVLDSYKKVMKEKEKKKASGNYVSGDPWHLMTTEEAIDHLVNGHDGVRGRIIKQVVERTSSEASSTSQEYRDALDPMHERAHAAPGYSLHTHHAKGINGIPDPDDEPVNKSGAIHESVVKKLHPGRFSGMSPQMAAIVGHVVGKNYTDPQITGLSVTSDGFVTGSRSGEEPGKAFIGSVSDLERNWNNLVQAADLTDEEHAHARKLLREKLYPNDWRTDVGGAYSSKTAAANRVQHAIDNLKKRDVPQENLDKLDKDLAIDFNEHFAYQNEQARAHAMGHLSTEEAQTVYHALGESHNPDVNGGWKKGTDVHTKVVVTQLMGELMAARLKGGAKTAAQVASCENCGQPIIDEDGYWKHEITGDTFCAHARDDLDYDRVAQPHEASKTAAGSYPCPSCPLNPGVCPACHGSQIIGGKPCPFCEGGKCKYCGGKGEVLDDDEDEGPDTLENIGDRVRDKIKERRKDREGAKTASNPACPNCGSTEWKWLHELEPSLRDPDPEENTDAVCDNCGEIFPVENNHEAKVASAEDHEPLPSFPDPRVCARCGRDLDWRGNHAENQEPDECVHGLSAWLCEGPGHYPQERGGPQGYFAGLLGDMMDLYKTPHPFEPSSKGVEGIDGSCKKCRQPYESSVPGFNQPMHNAPMREMLRPMKYRQPTAAMPAYPPEYDNEEPSECPKCGHLGSGDELYDWRIPCPNCGHDEMAEEERRDRDQRDADWADYDSDRNRDADETLRKRSPSGPIESKVAEKRFDSMTLPEKRKHLMGPHEYDSEGVRNYSESLNPSSWYEMLHDEDHDLDIEAEPSSHHGKPHKHGKVAATLSDVDKCKECGLIFENSHAGCQGHQNCMPECPRCGGEIDSVDTNDPDYPAFADEMRRQSEEENQMFSTRTSNAYDDHFICPDCGSSGVKKASNEICDRCNGRGILPYVKLGHEGDIDTLHVHDPETNEEFQGPKGGEPDFLLPEDWYHDVECPGCQGRGGLISEPDCEICNNVGTIRTMRRDRAE